MASSIGTVITSGWTRRNSSAEIFADALLDVEDVILISSCAEEYRLRKAARVHMSIMLQRGVHDIGAYAKITERHVASAVTRTNMLAASARHVYDAHTYVSHSKNV